MKVKIVRSQKQAEEQAMPDFRGIVLYRTENGCNATTADGLMATAVAKHFNTTFELKREIEIFVIKIDGLLPGRAKQAIEKL